MVPGFNSSVAAGSYYLARAYPDANQTSPAGSAHTCLAAGPCHPYRGHAAYQLESAGRRFPGLQRMKPEPCQTPPPWIPWRPSSLKTRPPHGIFNGRRLRTVIIDAGHGGHDPGAIGASGTREKRHRSSPLRKNWATISTSTSLTSNVVYTRTDDTFIDLHGTRSYCKSRPGRPFHLPAYQCGYPARCLRR